MKHFSGKLWVLVSSFTITELLLLILHSINHTDRSPSQKGLILISPVTIASVDRLVINPQDKLDFESGDWLQS